MAKSKTPSGNGTGGAPNKSDAIREALAQHPEATSKEIIDLLAAKQVKVTPTLVYYVRSKLKQAGRRAKRVSSASRGTAPLAAVRRPGSKSPDGLSMHPCPNWQWRAPSERLWCCPRAD